MKKHVQRVSLPLLFSFCCVFCGFLSVDAFAYNDEWHLYNRHETTYHGDSIDSIIDRTVPMSYISDGGFYRYEFTSSSAKTYSSLFFGNSVYNFYYPYDSELYDYYALGFLSINVPNISTSLNSSFDLSDIYLYEFNTDGSYDIINTNADINFSSNINSFIYNFSFPLDSYYDLSVLEFVFNPIIDYKSRSDVSEEFCVAVLAVSKDTSADEVNALIAAINNQTGALQGSIGQAADDVQQSIEDQYSGTPEDQLDIDSVITQHNEKMGVLSFGSDVMIQFLDIFSADNAGDATLTFPGFTLTVEGQDHQVWPDYEFNFALLDEWLPALMSVIRVMLPAFVWLMVLRYCVNVFEKNFLSNGG